MQSAVPARTKALGSVIRTAREAKGWSRATLAREAGVAQGTISNVELYGTAPRWDTVQRLAHALDIDVSQLEAA